MNGWSFRANGEALQWEGLAPEQNQQAEGQIAPDTLRALWGAVQEAAFFSWSQQEMGAPSWFITVTANGESHRVIWVRPLGQPADTTAAWEQLYTQLRTTAIQTFGERPGM